MIHEACICVSVRTSTRITFIVYMWENMQHFGSKILRCLFWWIVVDACEAIPTVLFSILQTAMCTFWKTSLNPFKISPTGLFVHMVCLSTLFKWLFHVPRICWNTHLRVTMTECRYSWPWHNSSHWRRCSTRGNENRNSLRYAHGGDITKRICSLSLAGLFIKFVKEDDIISIKLRLLFVTGD